MRSSLFPSETRSRLNEIHIQFLLIFRRLSPEKWNFGISSQTSDEDLDCLEDIRKPVLQRITKPEDVDTPSDDIVVLNRVHVLPSELEMRAKSEAMDMNFGSGSQNICLSAKLPPSSQSTHLHRDCIDIVNFLVSEVYDNLIETVVFTPLQSDTLVVRVITNVSHVCSSKFEKLRIRSFFALKELSLPLRILSSIENSAEHFAISILTLYGIGSLFENDLFGISMIFMQENLSKLGLLPQEITHTLNDLRFAEIVG